MQTVKCEKCGGQFPMNETLKIEDITLCSACGQKLTSEHKDIDIKTVKPQIDTTVCANCGKDHENQQLPLLAGLPVCSQCESFFKNRPFPAWVKVFLAAVFGLVIFASVWNIRFVQAYSQMRSSIRAFGNNDIEKAAQMMNSASKKNPQCDELRGWAAFYQGILFLQQDKSAQALEAFNSCQAILQLQGEEAEVVNQFIVSAKIGAAFDNKDYDQFLALSTENHKKYPADDIACAQVASAYACKFAVTGDEQFRENSLITLNKARTFEHAGPAFEEYEQRILHRLYTRQIIKRAEFLEQFPNGWKQPKKE